MAGTRRGRYYDYDAASGLGAEAVVLVDENGTYVAVGSSAAIPAGSAIIGKVGIDQTTPGTTDSVTISTAQGAGATIGAAADALVAAGAVGSLSAKLRRVTQSLEDLKSLIVLAAGSAIIGKVGVDQTTPGTTDSVTTKTKGFGSGRVSVTRTNDTNVYAANDVIGPATGSTAAITFPNMGPAAGGEIIITSVSFERDVAALISGETSYVLHLYNVTPPSVLGDNVAFDLPSGDRASYLGSINLGTPVDLGSTLYVASDAINKQITLLSGSIFGYLVTVGTYTPAASTVHVIQLHAVAA